MWEYNRTIIPPPTQANNELYHYGVIGMKWGHLRSGMKTKQNKRLEKRAIKYDKKKARAYRLSEYYHSRYDLRSANLSARKSARYAIRSAKNAKKALKSTNELKKALYEKRSEKLAYMSDKSKMHANRISKQKGYGFRAMNMSVRSDKMAIRASRARKKIASNNYYQAKLSKKISKITPEDLAGAYAFLGINK